MNIILNNAVGGDWGGAKGVDDSIFPTKYVIDYIRVYAPNNWNIKLKHIIKKDINLFKYI